MEYVLIGMGLLLAGFGMWAMAASAGLKAERKTAADLKAQLVKAAADAAQGKAASDAEIARREQLITTFKNEISDLEKALAANPDPVAARARLNQLLSHPGT